MRIAGEPACSVAAAVWHGRPWNTALFPSDYLGTDWQFFQRDVREHFKSPYLRRGRRRERERKGGGITFRHLPKKAQAPFCKLFLSAKIEGTKVKNLLPDTGIVRAGENVWTLLSVGLVWNSTSKRKDEEDRGGLGGRGIKTYDTDIQGLC